MEEAAARATRGAAGGRGVHTRTHLLPIILQDMATSHPHGSISPTWPHLIHMATSQAHGHILPTWPHLIKGLTKLTQEKNSMVFSSSAFKYLDIPSLQ